MSRPVISLTGGEPLLQEGFLREWLPEARRWCSIYLETSGIRFKEAEGLLDHVDIVSMDMKLPSATGMRPFWEEHRRFLSACRGRDLFVKTIVTAGTTVEDVLTATSIIAEADPTIPLILQPANGKDSAPAPLMLLRMQDAALPHLADVRVIPQVHRYLRLP